MKTNLTIRPATLDDCDFIIGLLPRFVELSSPPFRDPAQVTVAIGQVLCEALASTPSDCAILIASGIDGRRLGFIYLKTTTDRLKLLTTRLSFAKTSNT